MNKKLLAEFAPFGLRMQADLRDKIKASSEESGRSMNSEIISRLESSFSASSSERGPREKAFEDALNMLRFSLMPMKFKVVLDE